MLSLPYAVMDIVLREAMYKKISEVCIYTLENFLIRWPIKIAAETVRPARGKTLEEVLIKREAGGNQLIVLDRVGDGSDEIEAGIEIKKEPSE